MNLYFFSIGDRGFEARREIYNTLRLTRIELNSQQRQCGIFTAEGRANYLNEYICRQDSISRLKEKKEQGQEDKRGAVKTKVDWLSKLDSNTMNGLLSRHASVPSYIPLSFAALISITLLPRTFHPLSEESPVRPRPRFSRDPSSPPVNMEKDETR